MKKLLSVLFLLASVVTGSTAQNSDKRPGALTSDVSFTFDDIEFWVGEGENEAAIVIEWHDDYEPDAMVWGYRWNGEATGLDMIEAVAKADPRLIVLTQYTGWMGNTIGGIGYGNKPLDIVYDYEKAVDEYRNAFCFFEPIENPLLGQTSVPENAEEDVRKAIEEGLKTGVIYHPLNAEVYGYPSYDYDSWTCDNGIHWSAGWYDGYWSYFTREKSTAEFGYSGLGASSRKLKNGSWDAWSWNGDMSTMEGTSPSDSFIPAPAVPTSIAGVMSGAHIVNSGSSISFLNMDGYTCTITDVTGMVAECFAIRGSSMQRTLTLAKGMYIVSAADGSSRITKKVILN